MPERFDNFKEWAKSTLLIPADSQEARDEDDSDNEDSPASHANYNPENKSGDTILYDPQNGSQLRTLLKFMGPGYLVAVGYMDPGNWATDIAAGSRFGYSHLFVILLSSIIAVLFQVLCVRLGVVSRYDLAQQCSRFFSPKWNMVLYLLAEVSIIATDLAMIIGSAIALNLLFRIPLVAGVLLTGLDVMLMLKWWGRRYQRIYEAVIFGLVMIVTVCFVIQLSLTTPSIMGILEGFVPTSDLFRDPRMLYIAVSIVGATVMPHNLYLHASICKHRRVISARLPLSDEDEECEDEDEETLIENCESPHVLIDSFPALPHRKVNVMSLRDIGLTLRFAIGDTMAALLIAFFVNCTILIVGSAAFHERGQDEVEEIQDAYRLMKEFIGIFAATCFAIALLASGQSSSVTGTMAGQIIMSGFLKLRLKPVFRRILTRGLAIIPAMLTVVILGEAGLNSLLILSQVILSAQLPFAVFPLIYFTSNSELMTVKDGRLPVDGY